MLDRKSIGTLALTAAFGLALSNARAFDEAKYPDLSGQWVRAEAAGAPGSLPFDPSKPPGRAQQPPLTPEYQAIFEAKLRELEMGVPGTWPGPSCMPPGMPAAMTAYQPMEIVVLPDTTYIRIDYIRDTRRRIYTDGRGWPAHAEETFDGYSIGRWLDADGDGKFDVLEVETRHFKGPRVFDLSGIPLHEDNATVIKERIFLDRADKNLLHDEMTIIDNALTRPWTVMKNYRRNPDPKAQWPEYMCVEQSTTIRLGGEVYLLKDGRLAPARPGQEPPSVKYFTPARK
jgi:hypothetical protein